MKGDLIGMSEEMMESRKEAYLAFLQAEQELIKSLSADMKKALDALGPDIAALSWFPYSSTAR